MGPDLDYRSLAEADQKHTWHPFTPMQEWEAEEPLIVESARGCYLKDIQGREYLDGVSSLWTNLHGHRRPELDRAIIAQVRKVSHSTLLGLANVPSILLAQRLVEMAPPGLTRVFYSDNGSTAVEIALKMAFQYWQQVAPAGRSKTRFVSFKNGYHGDTIGAVGVGGVSLFHEIYRPLLFDSIQVESANCYRCPLGLVYPGCALACLGDLEGTLGSHHTEVAAVIIEPLVQGAGGMLVSPPGYLSRVRDICTRYDVLMIADEVAVGFGRTGRMFACEHEQVRPDLLCLAKGISGGYLPLAATLTTEEVFRAFLGRPQENRTFFHGHTYTGNPVACAAGLASLDIFSRDRTIDKLQGKIAQLEKGLRRFRELPSVGDTRQKGFMAGIELVADKAGKASYAPEMRMGARVARESRPRGAILRPLGDVVVLMPPLSIKKAELARLLDITYDSIVAATAPQSP
ncbi:MAG: adenosylmethionine--8-amino-7-oxononanoate transaminase [Dehalococcoidia bacterium]|nr:adenosylmethionine--8-amino-7-oxononanoate transaminase [Dehalococcoidia bacterium]